MTTLQAIVYGVIQGLTEFLPISSTAHLRVVPALLGWEDPGAAFTAVIQWGTLVAVLLYFRRDIALLTLAFFQGLAARKPFGTVNARLAWMIAVGTVPVVVCGLFFKKYIEGKKPVVVSGQLLNLRSIYVISFAAIGLALVLLVAELLVKRRQQAGVKQKEIQELDWWDGIVVGLWQAAALIPGASRSGVTITGGLFRNMTRDTAARYSFLLSLPAIFGAGLKELYDERHELLASQADAVNLIVASVVAGILGYLTIAFLLNYLKRHTTYVFIAYRIALGAFLLWLLQAGTIAPDAGQRKDDTLPPTAAAAVTEHRPERPL